MPSQKENNLPIINFQVLCYFRESTALRCFQSAIASTSNPSSAHHMYHISLEHWKPNPPVTIDETTGWATRSHSNGLLKKTCIHIYLPISISIYSTIYHFIYLTCNVFFLVKTNNCSGGRGGGLRPQRFPMRYLHHI